MGSLRDFKRKIKYPKALQCLHGEYFIETALIPPMPDIDYFTYHSWLCKISIMWKDMYSFKCKFIGGPILDKPLEQIFHELKYESDLIGWKRCWETETFVEEGHISIKTDYFSFHECITRMMHAEYHSGGYKKYGFGRPWFDFGLLRGLLKGMFRPVTGLYWLM